MSPKLSPYHPILALFLLVPPGMVLISSALHQNIQIGSRPSSLARIQAESVAAALRRSDPSGVLSTELVQIASRGDIRGRGRQESPLAMSPPDFVGTIDAAVADGTVDVGVHSLKDVPPDRRWAHADRLIIGCHLPRANPFDVLLGGFSSIDDLPLGAKVGSASIRRQAQLLSRRPDVICVNLRGNVQARLDALEAGEVNALIMARAGLDRLGVSIDFGGAEEAREGVVGTLLPPDDMLPGCCQGIVAAVCRRDDEETLCRLHAADDHDASVAAEAERAVLNTVDGSAPWEGRPPLAALMSRVEGAGWEMNALLARPDGSRVVCERREAPPNCGVKDSRELGRQVGKELLRLAGSDFFA